MEDLSALRAFSQRLSALLRLVDAARETPNLQVLVSCRESCRESRETVERIITVAMGAPLDVTKLPYQVTADNTGRTRQGARRRRVRAGSEHTTRWTPIN